MSQLDSDALRAWIDDRAARHQFSGVALVRAKGDTIFQHASGLAHRGHRVPVTVETRFQVASVTKMITAATTLKMVEEGALSLNRPLTGYLPSQYRPASLDDDVRLVLTKRPETMPTHAGHISFPGGRAHPEDSGPVDTALREAHEEVGIEPDRVEVLGFLPPIDTVEFKPLVVPVVGRVATPLNLVPSEREVARIHTPRLDELADGDRWWHVPWDGRQVWYYDLDGDTLWGATAHMVRSLLGLPDYVSS